MRAGLCGFKSALRAGYGGSLVDYGRCKIMRKTTPHRRLRNVGCGHAVTCAIENADILKGAAYAAALPSAGQSLNSRGFQTPGPFAP